MSDSMLLDEFAALAPHEQMILAQLALIGEPVGRTALLDQLDSARVLDTARRPLDVGSLDQALLRLERLAFISVVVGRGFVCNPKLRWPALRAAIAQHMLDDLCRAYETLAPLRQTWNSMEPRSYRAGIARLRMGYLRGHTPQQIQPLLTFCLGSYEAAQLHPVLEIFGRPFEPEMLAPVHPLLRDDVLEVLLQAAQYAPATAPTIRLYCQQHQQNRQATGDDISMELRMALAEDAILCGRCDDAERYLTGTQGWQSQYLAASVRLLRGDTGAALTGYEAALKILRRETGKRTRLFSGMGSYLYMLALLRSDDAKHRTASSR